MTTATVTDVDSWGTWADTALEAGEPALAERILRHLATAGDLEPVRRRWVSAALASCLVQQGRPDDAAALLVDGGLERPAGAGTAGRSHVVHAAAAAATGDESAFRWLLGVAVAVDGTPMHAGVVSHLAAAADGRWQGVADDAWSLLVGRHGVRDPYRVARSTAVTLLRRDREAPPTTLRRLMAGAADNLMAVAPDALTDHRPTAEVVGQLRARGDTAGAALLERALVRRLGGPGLRGAAARPLPRPARPPLWYPLAALLAIVVVVAGGVFGPPLVTALALAALPLGRLAWARVVPRPGLTRAESRAWRTVGVDAAGTPVRPDVTVSLLVAGACVVAALVAVAVLLAPQADRAPVWFAERAALLWLGAPALAAWGALSAVREGTRVTLVRAEHRRRRAPAALGPDGTCRCATVIGFTGAGAADYFWGHLRTTDEPTVTEAARAVVPASVVARCPSTGATWLCGPVGRYGRPLALRGPYAPTPALDADDQYDAGTGDVDAAPGAAATEPAGPSTGQGFYL